MTAVGSADSDNELRRTLGGRQSAMIGIGGAIGTGLFLGSAFAISLAGPAVIVSYLVAALLALVVAWALAEMVVVHPTAGSFGAIAHAYLGSWAGFVVRWIYWLGLIVVIGAALTAAGTYFRFWYPGLPLWVPVVGSGIAVFVMNAATVRTFGGLEYWLSMIKVVTIVVFAGLGIVYLGMGLPNASAVGLTHLTAHGGFAPDGISGIWMGIVVAGFSYGGVEIVAITAAESRQPGRALPKATAAVVLGLAFLYCLAVAVIVTVAPWQQTAQIDALEESPFVTLLDLAGVPVAASIMNFVVLTAALTSMGALLYVTSRIGHSLAMDGYLPSALSRLDRRGVPQPALILSATGMVVAAVLSVTIPETAFLVLVGIAIFGGITTWIFILITQVVFRRRRAAAGLPGSPAALPGGSWTSAVTAVILLATLVTTAFIPGLDIAWRAGLPLLVGLILLAVLLNRSRSRSYVLADFSGERQSVPPQ